jgi:hypothetical protein
MPIVYIHGVATRSREEPFGEVERYLRRLVAPVLSDRPEEVAIRQAYWGDIGVSFAWNGASRPRSLLLGQGAAGASATPAERALLAAALKASLDALPATAPAATTSSGLISGRQSQAPATAALRLKDLSSDELSDLLADLLAATATDAGRRVEASLAADALAHDPGFLAALAAAPDTAAECDLIVARLRGAVTPGLAPMGGAGDWLRDMGDRLHEAAGRAASLPGAAASVVAGELRKDLNDFVSLFLGDVFAYLKGRFGDDGRIPVTIPSRLLDALLAARADQLLHPGEPIVLLSHSMGGQIAYDVLTHFMPQDMRFRDVRVDFWCATASQVGFFEEAKLFRASRDEFKTGHPVPFPAAHLGAWWNVWDHNDFISFTAKGIIDGVDDEPYHSGMSLVGAHSGYLQRPSFYRRLADKLRQHDVTGGT